MAPRATMSAAYEALLYQNGLGIAGIADGGDAQPFRSLGSARLHLPLSVRESYMARNWSVSGAATDNLVSQCSARNGFRSDMLCNFVTLLDSYAHRR